MKSWIHGGEESIMEGNFFKKNDCDDDHHEERTTFERNLNEKRRDFLKENRGSEASDEMPLRVRTEMRMKMT